MEETSVNEAWDARKIMALLLLIAIIFLSFKTFVLDKNSPQNAIFQPEKVKGISTQASPISSPQVSSEDIKKSVENKLSDLKKEVNNINVIEIATSTPAVQKVLDDVKKLQSFPQSQARQACLQICNGL